MLLFKEKIQLPADAEDMSLCYLGNDGYQAQGTRLYRKLVSQPRYVCKNCGRAAHDAKNLCRPELIEKSAEPSEPADVTL
jgi:hypothetical protein